MGTNVVMPQLGESVVEGKISKWLKKAGDPVKLYEPILEVETDKVTTEVTAAASVPSSFTSINVLCFTLLM